MNIFVGNLSFDLTEEDLRQEFTAFGEVTSVNIVTDKYSGRSRGFAFVDLCRKRYDVVIMNPPFGEVSADLSDYLAQTYSTWNKNILCRKRFGGLVIYVLNGKYTTGGFTHHLFGVATHQY